MSYLIDANVLCESNRSQPEPDVISWLREHDEELLISVLTLGELMKGIQLLETGKRRREIERWYGRIEQWAANRLLIVDLAVITTWARLYAKHQKAGRKLPLTDSLLAATAIRHGLTLVTRNIADFTEEVSVLNPWAL